MSLANCDALSQAMELHKCGRAAAALALLSEAIDQDPDNAGLWVMRAIVRHGRSLWAGALSDAEQAMTLAPLPRGGQLVLADGYAHLGKVDLALLGYKHLLESGPLPSDLYAGLYAGFRRCGRNDLALQACRDAVEESPDNHAAYFGMAHCMSSLNYSAIYIAGVLRSATQLDPDNVVYRTSLAIQLVRAGKPEDAHAELVQVSPDDLHTIECVCSARRLIQLCAWAGDEERAEELGRVIGRLSGRDRGRG